MVKNKRLRLTLGFFIFATNREVMNLCPAFYLNLSIHLASHHCYFLHFSHLPLIRFMKKGVIKELKKNVPSFPFIVFSAVSFHTIHNVSFSTIHNASFSTIYNATFSTIHNVSFPTIHVSFSTIHNASFPTIHNASSHQWQVFNLTVFS